MKSKLHDAGDGAAVGRGASAVARPVEAEARRNQHGAIRLRRWTRPSLPVPPQRAGGVGDSAGADTAGKGVPAQPSIQGLQSSKGQGQIIALGLSPADVRGPIEVPSGNRSGEFHASPSGKPDAPGTPNIAGTPGATNGGAGGGKGNGSGNGNGNGSAPAGIIGRGRATRSGDRGGRGHPGEIAQRCADGGAQEAHCRRYEPVGAQRQPSAGRAPPPTMSDSEDDALERQVFGAKKYYSLVLNMPNLTSATGSWIVRFAELKQSDNKVAIAAPVARVEGRSCLSRRGDARQRGGHGHALRRDSHRRHGERDQGAEQRRSAAGRRRRGALSRWQSSAPAPRPATRWSWKPW